MTEESLFHEALAQATPHERAAFLDAACAGKPQLRAAVEALLAAHEASGHPLDRSAAARPEINGAHPDLHERTTDHYVLREAAAGALIVGRYTLVEPIGEGGMGEVWVAKQTEPVKRKVALKLVKPGMDSRAMVQRFEQERQALALMDHPNIARVLDGGLTEDHRPYFVMELVNGLPLTRFCDEAKLGIRARLELFVPICQAVQHAHSKGVVHRDLKPSNILVTLIDGKPVPRIIDFGVAKALSGKLTDAPLSTLFGAVVGTLEYMAPEQAGYSGADVDTRADVYSLGVILYELLTGLRPFDNTRLRRAAFDELIRMIREEEPSKPSKRLSGDKGSPSLAALRQTEPGRLAKLLRGELDWVVMKCLEKQRDRRYETASGLARDVQRYLADEPVEARPPSAGYRLGKFLRRNKGPVLAAGLLVFALIGSAFGLIQSEKRQQVAVLWQQAEQERDAARLARGEAESARDSEAKARREAEEAREQFAALEYGRTIELAYHDCRENNFASARALLERTGARFRGWEWRFVHRLCHADIHTFQGHTGPVYSASFSPDGSRLVTGSADGTAKVWDARTGAVLLSLQADAGRVFSATFGPGGTQLVTKGDDGTAKVWDATTGAKLLTLKDRSGGMGSATFNRDGTRIATAGWDVTIWDARTGAELFTFKKQRDVSFSPDGTLVVTRNQDGTTAKVWDARRGKEMVTLKGQVNGLATSFSPDGSRVAAGSGGGTAKVWDVKTGDVVLTLQGQTAGVTAASFSPDGSRIVAADDRTARVWDAKTGAELFSFKGHGRAVESACFSPDGKRVVTASADATAKVWDVKPDASVLTISAGHGGVVYTAAFSTDGARVVTAAYDRTARVWDARTCAELVAFKGHTDLMVSTAAFSPDGSRVISASMDGTAKVWDAKTGAELFSLKGRFACKVSACFSPNGSRVVTGGIGGMVAVWDAETGAVVRVLKKGGESIHSASFSPDGSRVLAGFDKGIAKVWDAESGAEVFTLKGHKGEVASAAFSPDGSRIVTGSHDQTAKVWDAKSGAEIFTLSGHTDVVASAAFSPDGSRIVTGSWDSTAKVWDAKSGAEVLTLMGHSGHVYSASFSPDGSRVLTASADGTVKVWDATPVHRDWNTRR
ncbi:MAG: serine/threonine-protein kinase [Gemmataceae bacterium]